MEIFGPFLISTLAGLSTIIGGLITFIKLKDKDSFITFCLSFSASVMISLSIFELIPESTIPIISKLGYVLGTILLISIFLLGVISVNLINKKIKVEKSSNNNLYKVGILSMIALMLHNFPEGIATFMSAYKDMSLGISLGIAIMLHNIPEGISIAVPLYYSTGSRKKGLLLSFISGLAEPLGALITFLLLKPFISNELIGIILIFVAGLMITLGLNELLPEALSYNKQKPLKLGLIFGFILTIINLILF